MCIRDRSSSALIGTWERISCTYQYQENGEIVDEGKDEGNDLVGFKLVFKEDGTCKIAEYHTDKWDWFDEGKWSYSNGIITITDNNESESIKAHLHHKEDRSGDRFHCHSVYDQHGLQL